MCLIVGFFSVLDQQLSHVIDNHANPLAVHDVEAAHFLKASKAVLECRKHLISIALTLPTTLLVKEARMLEEASSPEYECFPLSLVLSDACSSKNPSSVLKVLWHLLVIDLVLSFYLHTRIEKFDHFRGTSSLYRLR